MESLSCIAVGPDARNSLSMLLDASAFVASTPAATTETRREGRGRSDLL